MRYWSTPPITDRAAAVDLMNEIQEGFRQQSMLKWGVARRTDNALIGTTTLYNLDFSNRRAEMGYALGREHWGQGYMAEALQALLAYCFDVLDLRRIEADVDPRNAASIQTLNDSVSSARDSCASVGKWTEKSRTRCSMDCCGKNGRDGSRELRWQVDEIQTTGRVS